MQCTFLPRHMQRALVAPLAPGGHAQLSLSQQKEPSVSRQQGSFLTQDEAASAGGRRKRMSACSLILMKNETTTIKSHSLLQKPTVLVDVVTEICLLSWGVFSGGLQWAER